jgi:DNA-binding MarR family transcriptional regulator
LRQWPFHRRAANATFLAVNGKKKRSVHRTAASKLEADTFLNLMRAHAALMNGLAEVLRPYDISQPQYNVLRILRGAGPKGLLRGQVGERMVTRVPDVTRLLDRMESLGQVTRERGEDDRRSVRVRLTPEGMRIVNSLDKPIRQMHQTQFAHFSKAEIEAFNQLLLKAKTPRE